mmetsp:Transcript_54028/g.132455  ORF Transcript_54028/g.132455 Transcript_54028/m.132455 type:complete len:82 (+) Transcript_54028:1673-1918(+)
MAETVPLATGKTRLPDLELAILRSAVGFAISSCVRHTAQRGSRRAQFAHLGSLSWPTDSALKPRENDRVGPNSLKRSDLLQ